MNIKFSKEKLLELARQKAKNATLFRKAGMWRFARDESKQAYVFRKMVRGK